LHSISSSQHLHASLTSTTNATANFPRSLQLPCTYVTEGHAPQNSQSPHQPSCVLELTRLVQRSLTSCHDNISFSHFNQSISSPFLVFRLRAYDMIDDLRPAAAGSRSRCRFAPLVWIPSLCRSRRLVSTCIRVGSCYHNKLLVIDVDVSRLSLSTSRCVVFGRRLITNSIK
jgi:hypothetical protein